MPSPEAAGTASVTGNLLVDVIFSFDGTRSVPTTVVVIFPFDGTRSVPTTVVVIFSFDGTRSVPTTVVPYV